MDCERIESSELLGILVIAISSVDSAVQGAVSEPMLEGVAVTRARIDRIVAT